MGEWENESFERLGAELNFFPQLFANEHHKAPGGESRFDVQQRVTTALEEIIDRHPANNLVVVSHGISLSLVLDKWFGDSERSWVDFHKDNTAFSEITFEPRNLQSFNNTPHLDRLHESE